jgi:O-methyltransferase domain/Dimerisation domain
MDASALVMDTIFGWWRSQLLYIGVKAGVFDALAKKPKKAQSIAKELKLDARLSYRLLRSLSAMGLLKEQKGQSFQLTAAGELLRADHPRTLRGVALLENSPQHYAAWTHVPDILRDGKQDAFIREFGRTIWEYQTDNLEYAEVFDLAMSGYSNMESRWVVEALKGYDFSEVETLCDVGGGQGHLMSSLLVAYPKLKGIVFERPEVIEDESRLWAGKMKVARRGTYVGGDVFTGPIPKADAYFLKHMLQNFNDKECVQLLKNIVKATKPKKVPVFICEFIVPPPGEPHFAKVFDMHMMCTGTGQERSQAEYTALLKQVGGKYVETRESSGLMSVIVGELG